MTGPGASNGAVHHLDDGDAGARGYTRASVERYLREVADQRAELEAAIADARSRYERASSLEHRIEALEKRVGEWIAWTITRQRSGDATAAGAVVTGPANQPVVTSLRAPGSADPAHDAIARLEQLQARLQQARLALRPESIPAVDGATRDGESVGV
ncbi:MAG: CHASE3 domain-containing protein [Acidimicrobiales bacterium]|jgi:CHASE3 domain sensor protein